MNQPIRLKVQLWSANQIKYMVLHHLLPEGQCLGFLHLIQDTTAADVGYLINTLCLSLT